MPGKPLYFATAMPLGGDALGLLVKSHDFAVDHCLIRQGRQRIRCTFESLRQV